MKNLIGHDIGSYIFNAAASTITFNGLPAFTLDQILMITNVGPNIIIYNFANPSTNGGTLAGNVLTLDYNTSAMSNTDPLQIYIDFPTTAPIDTANAIDGTTHMLLKSIAQSVASLASVDNALRQRVSLDAAPASITVGTLPTLANVTTLGTVTNPVPVGNVATMGGGNPEYQMMESSRIAYQGIRSQLAFSN